MRRTGRRRPLMAFHAAVLLSLAGSVAWAAKPSSLTQVKPGEVSAPLRTGTITGGQAAEEFSLVNVQTKSVAGSERIIFSYGDVRGKPVQREPGFFNIVLDRESKRLVIDLAQVNRTAVDPTALRRILSNSKLIAGSDMTMDPQDNSTNLTLNLKKPVQIRVASQSRSEGQLVLELRPVEGQAVKKQ